ncbi:MAG: hypothetical protein HYY30_00950 [Chloroflexi bacterium]|nr:hypothetical protein [Chloroflexota bacterium]
MSDENREGGYHEKHKHEEHKHGDYGKGKYETVDWERWGRSLRRTGYLTRVFAISAGASLGAQAVIGLWRWLRRPPGG